MVSPNQSTLTSQVLLLSSLCFSHSTQKPDTLQSSDYTSPPTFPIQDKSRGYGQDKSREWYESEAKREYPSFVRQLPILDSFVLALRSVGERNPSDLTPNEPRRLTAGTPKEIIAAAFALIDKDNQYDLRFLDYGGGDWLNRSPKFRNGSAISTLTNESPHTVQFVLAKNGEPSHEDRAASDELMELLHRAPTMGVLDDAFFRYLVRRCGKVIRRRIQKIHTSVSGGKEGDLDQLKEELLADLKMWDEDWRQRDGGRSLIFRPYNGGVWPDSDEEGGNTGGGEDGGPTIETRAEDESQASFQIIQDVTGIDIRDSETYTAEWLLDWVFTNLHNLSRTETPLTKFLEDASRSGEEVNHEVRANTKSSATSHWEEGDKAKVQFRLLCAFATVFGESRFLGSASYSGVASMRLVRRLSKLCHFYGGMNELIRTCRRWKQDGRKITCRWVEDKDLFGADSNVTENTQPTLSRSAPESIATASAIVQPDILAKALAGEVRSTPESTLRPLEPATRKTVLARFPGVLESWDSLPSGSQVPVTIHPEIKIILFFSLHTPPQLSARDTENRFDDFYYAHEQITSSAHPIGVSRRSCYQTSTWLDAYNKRFLDSRKWMVKKKWGNMEEDWMIPPEDVVGRWQGGSWMSLEQKILKEVKRSVDEYLDRYLAVLGSGGGSKLELEPTDDSVLQEPALTCTDI